MKIMRNICTRTKYEKNLEYHQNFKIVECIKAKDDYWELSFTHIAIKYY